MFSENITYDVVVAGGGISGTMAAIAAAREGCRTLLVERHAALGGMSTTGLVQPITTWGINNKYVIAGTGKKMLEDLAAQSSDAATPMNFYGPCCDGEYLKMYLEKKAIESGVTLLYYTWIKDVLMGSDNSIEGLIGLSKNGEFKISGKIFIDATGDGDMCSFANIPFESDIAGVGQQAVTLMFQVSGIERSRCPENNRIGEIWKEYGVGPERIAVFWHPRENTAFLNATEIVGIDGLKAEDLTRATIECREQAWVIMGILKKHVPGFEHAYISQTASTLGVRETRRIKGLYMLNEEDVISGRHFDDVIARAACPVDIHLRNNIDKGMYRWLKKSYAIPYRCLVTKEVPNLIATGRCISTDQIAHSTVRRMAPGFALGEAAGAAAFLARKEGDVRKISIEKLQNTLTTYGAILQPEE